MALRRLNCGYQLLSRRVRKGEPSSVMVWYVSMRPSMTDFAVSGKKISLM
jgi:hypothetical protein